MNLAFPKTTSVSLRCSAQSFRNRMRCTSVFPERVDNVRALCCCDGGATRVSCKTAVCSNRALSEEADLTSSFHQHNTLSQVMSRREGCVNFISSIVALGAQLANPSIVQAVMGMTAGRVPGLAPADSKGIRRYTRPEGKSGGHGVGWSEITPYTFDVSEGWEEVPVSIADPGGTEIDVRFSSDSEGDLKVVLAPVLRFTDVKEDENPTIEELIPLERFMSGFGPELTQNPVESEDIIDKFVDSRFGLTYYNFELRNHTLVTATIWKKRVFIMCVQASSLQWRTSAEKLRDTTKSFAVLTEQT